MVLQVMMSEAAYGRVKDRMPDGVEADSPEAAERREFARQTGLPSELMLGPIPRNEAELYARLASLDAQDAFSLCRLGCFRRAQGDAERALTIVCDANLVADAAEAIAQIAAALDC